MHSRQEPQREKVQLRLATVDDVDALVDLFATFFAESGYPDGGIEFDPERAKHYLTQAISTGHEPHIIAPIDGKIVGSISYEIDHTFSKKPFAVMGEVYALEEYRGLGLGRALIHSAMDMAKHVDHATCLHIPITSGHEAVPTLVNAFRKFGAEQIGVIMRARL
jgi:ribosomal protein S18 acetylase RimI-like enzyme